jgi:hypothetical protein
MRRHGQLRYPPGYITYGLDTYSSILCKQIDAWTPRLLEQPSRRLQRMLRGVADLMIVHTLRTAQGLYSDGWAAPMLKYMLGSGSGVILLQGSLPDFGSALRDQQLRITCDGVEVARFSPPFGDFQFTFEVTSRLASSPANFQIEASKWIVPSEAGIAKDPRRLAYMLKAFSWV